MIRNLYYYLLNLLQSDFIKNCAKLMLAYLIAAGAIVMLLKLLIDVCHDIAHVIIIPNSFNVLYS